ncbi:transcription factor bHLH96-like [Hibiscus syriacus]|uniref:Transcription factor bHLH96-like n=1 Tax=Hibiscus syriacus TaxID=106335 RepID=A0A6A3A6T6_HIBSY|nr:transcription factor bHLH96-like [Hibiscus syriacus]
MLDGTEVTFKSVKLKKFVCAENGGGMDISVNRDSASSWETFTLWRVTESEFQFRATQGQFLTCYGNGCTVSATAKLASSTETFQIERNNNGRVHIKTKGGAYLQATIDNQLTADNPGNPGWDDNAAVFEMSIVANNLHGDYQLANGYGYSKAKEVLETYRRTFINAGDFEFLQRTGINTVQIPDGWWIAYDPNPPAPFIGGTTYKIKCIIDLHAAPGSQNRLDYIRIGFADIACHKFSSFQVAASIPLDILVPYYKQGYEIVRKHSPSAYVIVCQRIGNADPIELYKGDIGSHNVVVDLHYYNLFDPYFITLSPIDNIQFIYKSREPQVQALNAADGPLVFIGEWVNEWNVTNGTQSEYQDFGKAQLEVYNAASFGWSYWTIKNDREHWDFEWNIRNNYLQFSKYSKPYFRLCEAPYPASVPESVLELHVTYVLAVQRKKPRVLCLLGFRTSGEILKKMIGKWPESVLRNFDLDFLDGSYPARGKSDVESLYDPPYYQWYQVNKGTAFTKVPKIKFVIIISGFALQELKRLARDVPIMNAGYGSFVIVQILAD